MSCRTFVKCVDDCLKPIALLRVVCRVAAGRDVFIEIILSAIVIGDNLLPIIVIAQNSFDLSITDIAFVLYFAIADKSWR